VLATGAETTTSISQAHAPQHAQKPLNDGQVTYDEWFAANGPSNTQLNVAAFHECGRPGTEARKGPQAPRPSGYDLFNWCCRGLLYFTKKRVWASAHLKFVGGAAYQIDQEKGLRPGSPFLHPDVENLAIV